MKKLLTITLLIVGCDNSTEPELTCKFDIEPTGYDISFGLILGVDNLLTNVGDSTIWAIDFIGTATVYTHSLVDTVLYENGTMINTSIAVIDTTMLEYQHNHNNWNYNTEGSSGIPIDSTKTFRIEFIGDIGYDFDSVKVDYRNKRAICTDNPYVPN